jgi:predicted nuclease of restriction endonuclease-like (RecB) superfamily
MKKKAAKKVSALARQILSQVVRELKSSSEPAFTDVLQLIQAAKQRAFQAVNGELVTLYWQVGEYISRKLASAEWGDGVVAELAAFLARTQPGLRGFTRASLFRMRQFYEAYAENEIVAPLLRQLPWTHHTIIMGRCRLAEEREFYIRMAHRERWRSRELERQIRACLFDLAVMNPPKVAAALRQLQPLAAEFFKDTYTLEFLGLPADHSEADLHAGLLRDLGRFITELGRDFCFIGSQHPLQVGGQDFALDLLFFHRGMNCLVAIELKAREFRPSDLGQINFYREALDRDHRKPHENPSVGLLLCATKDSEVVEYALNRSLSPAMVAEPSGARQIRRRRTRRARRGPRQYERMLPAKELLKAKLHELYQLLAPGEDDEETESARPAPKPKRKQNKTTK